jgi:hypothetical protein
MYILIWQSVMWRPGKGWFLVGVKEPVPYPVVRDCQTACSLMGASSPLILIVVCASS